MSAPIQNRLLASLSPQACALLVPHLTRVTLEQGTILYEAGDTITQTYFPQTMIVSIVTHLPDGPGIECGAVGREGAIGFIGAACVNVALRQTVVQLKGDALVIEAEVLQDAVDQSAELLDLMLWHATLMQSHAFQLIACNAHHTVEQRLARWLMQLYDRVDTKRFPLKQEVLAGMLGVRRASISEAAQALQRRALINYHRGLMEVRYPEQLRQACCPCYELMRGAPAWLPRRQRPRVPTCEPVVLSTVP